MENLLSLKDASSFLGLRPAMLYKYVCKRTIPFIKLGARVLFDPSRLSAWVAEHSHEPMR